MQNDAKLGFLAGVAGVITAAVLFYQNQPPPAGTPPTKGSEARTASAPSPAATPIAPAKAAVPAGPAVVSGGGGGGGGGRKELQGQTASRNSDDE